MAEYITAKDLDDFRDDIMDRFLSLCDYNDYKKLTLLRIGETINEIYDEYCEKPLADVVEVVRCKDCKHRHKDSWCEYADDDDNFYCARGERK